MDHYVNQTQFSTVCIFHIFFLSCFCSFFLLSKRVIAEEIYSYSLTDARRILYCIRTYQIFCINKFCGKMLCLFFVSF